MKIVASRPNPPRARSIAASSHAFLRRGSRAFSRRGSRGFNPTGSRDFNPTGSRGFSLVEVLVALVVCSIGLLGLAKMESLALSSTGVAGNRSIAAIQASSLAAAMHANQAYWGSGLAPASTTVTVVNGVPAIVFDNNPLGAVVACTTPGANACTPDQLAAYDVSNWSNALAGLMKNSLATVSCTTAGLPVSCNIQIQWTENAVAMNPQQTQLNALAAPTYVLYVQP
jgi:type IV pilus assembly protein PilV